VPRADLAYGGVGDDGDGMAVQLIRPALKLLSRPAAHAGRQLVCLHGVGNRFPTCRGEDARALGSRRVSWPMLQSELGTEAEASCARRGSSCEAETCRARCRLVGGGPSVRELVGDVLNWSGTGRLASEGLD
jgi:hypothetical protein